MWLLTAWVVAGRQENAAGSLAFADDMAGSRGRQDAVLADQELLHPVRGANLGNKLDDLGVPEATISANDEERALKLSSVQSVPHLQGGVRRSAVPSTPSGMERRMLATKASL